MDDLHEKNILKLKKLKLNGPEFDPSELDLLVQLV